MKLNYVLWSFLLVARAFAFTYSNRLPGPYTTQSQTIGISNFQFKTAFDYWTSNGYLDLDGNDIEQAANQSFRETDVEFDLIYGYRRSFDIFGFFRYRQIHSVKSDHDVTTSGPEVIGGGAKYNFPQASDWDFSLSASYLVSIWRPTAYSSYAETPTSEVALGDGENYFDAKAHGSLKTASGYIVDLMAGLRIYDSNQSQEVIYDAALVKVTNEWAFKLGMEGAYSLKTDPFTDTPGSKYFTGRQSTQRYNSINETFHSPYAAVHMLLDQKNRLEFKGYSVIAGNFTDKGYGGVVSWVYKWKNKKTKEQVFVESFKDYDIEGYVTKVSPRGRFVKIDRGLTDDLEKGNRIDFFKSNAEGDNLLIASGRVFEAKTSSSIVKIEKRYRNIRLKEGFVARSRSR